MFYPDSMKFNIPLAPVVLTDLKIFNKSVTVGREDSLLRESITVTKAFTLSYRQNVFAFEYATLNFAPPEKNRYLYQMAGFNEEWIEAGTSRIATFTNLDPGEYVFRVKAAHDTSDAYVASLKLIITLPPWKTWWAYSIYALLAIESVLQGGAPMNSHIAKKVLDLFKKLAAPPTNYGLTNREKEILKLLVEGLSKKQIATKIFLSYHTVDTHIRNIYQKLEVHTRSGAVAKALKEHLL